MAKIRKSFRQHYELVNVSLSVDNLIDIYGLDATLKDILYNVEENKAKWEECPACKGNQYVMLKKKYGEKVYVKCPQCHGHGWTRIKKEKEA